MDLPDLPAPPSEPAESGFDRRLEALLEAAPDAFVCVEGSGRIALVNSRVSTLFGYDRTELVGAAVEMLLPEALRELHVRHRAGFNEQPHVRSMGSGLPLVAQRRDGSVFPVEVSLVPWLAAEQGWVIAAVRDVSEQRALAATSRENEARLRQIAESVDLVFILLQLDPPEYLYVSAGAEQLVGIHAGARTSAYVRDAMALVHPEDRDRVEHGFLADCRAGLPVRSEHRILSEDGQVTWVRAVATPVSVDGGPIERTVITLEDVTERVEVTQALRRAEAEARAANDSKNHFLSRMSHELRTPLNAVLGFGQLLSRQLHGTEHAEAVEYVLKGGQHLLDLINDVLDISRIESGEMSLSMETITLAGLVDETRQLMGPIAAAGDVTIATPVGDPAVLLFGDRQRVRQILLNLMSNAIKYNRSGGQVWVSWQLEGALVHVRVRDEGPGVPTELQGRLFLPFERLGAESTEVEGAGIGLALTRSLAELMGGSVGVESVVGHGSTFTLSLPARLAADDAVVGSRRLSPPALAPAGAAALDPDPATLLYIEDNEPNVHVVEHLLRLRPAWRLIHAGLGGLGVELARAHRPDVVLLDLHLPDQPGRDVLRELKRHDDTAQIPVVILTADASPGLERTLLGSGAAQFLTKPLDVEAVLSMLDDVSRRRAGIDPDAERSHPDA